MQDHMMNMNYEYILLCIVLIDMRKIYDSAIEVGGTKKFEFCTKGYR